VLPGALPSLLLAALVLGVLTVVVMWLDAQYLESAVRAGQRAHERIERMRRGGMLAFRMPSGTRATWLRVPLPPRLGGAGPIVWRQITTAVRQSRAVLLLLLVMCVALGPVLHFLGSARHRDPIALVVSLVLSMNALFANALRFDFRGDLDQLDVLKSLPVGAAVIVSAQLVAPTLVLTLCQLVLFVGAGVFLHISTNLLLSAVLIAVPLNVFVFAIENALFLHFPARIWAASPGDVQGVGRRMTIFFAKTTILMAAFGAAAGIGVAAWMVTGKSALAFVVATASVLTLETAALMPLMVTAFRRLDPSLDAPL